MASVGRLLAFSTARSGEATLSRGKVRVWGPRSAAVYDVSWNMYPSSSGRTMVGVGFCPVVV